MEDRREHKSNEQRITFIADVYNTIVGKLLYLPAFLSQTTSND